MNRKCTLFLTIHPVNFSTPKLPVSGTNPVVSDKPFINPSDPRATGPVRSPGLDRDQSAERLDKKGKSTGKSKNKKKSSIVSAAAGKPGDLPSNMPSIGYSLPISTDVPVVPASQPVFTGPTSQPTSISSVPASSATSAPAAGCGLTGSQQFVLGNILQKIRKTMQDSPVI